jgi:phosphoribosylanthranilate isomerase
MFAVLTGNWKLTTGNWFSMTWVKICGMTNLEDALVAVDAGADAVGFVFYEKSPRYVSVEAAREIVEKLPESVEKIGVFVDGHIDPADALFKAGLTGTQVYLTKDGFAGGKGQKATGRSAVPARARFMIALPMNLLGDDYAQLGDFAGRMAKMYREVSEKGSFPDGTHNTVVLDSGSTRQPGGTGRSFDWEKAKTVIESINRNQGKIVVAGGLNSGNVREAIKVLTPWGVDVVSGVEARPGKKDPEKVRAFVRAVREMDAKAN